VLRRRHGYPARQWIGVVGEAEIPVERFRFAGGGEVDPYGVA
jgi:hypothetical protein